MKGVLVEGGGKPSAGYIPLNNASPQISIYSYDL